MEHEFFCVSSEVRRVAMMADVDLHDLKGALKRWEREVRKADAVVRKGFFDMHYSEMTRIVQKLRSMAKGDPDIRGYHDRIFSKLFDIGKHIPTDTTRIFGLFIKGITYYRYQSSVEVPVYHRLYACGPGDDAFRKTFQQCTPDMPREQRNDVRKRIETCYIERLIYDELFKYYTLHFPIDATDEGVTQDEGHQHRLQVTKDDFRSCFPNLDISVDVEYDMHWPVSVRIKRYVHGTIVSIEMYRRHITFEVTGTKHYEDVVYATRKTKDHTYIRNQSFDHVPSWKKVDARGTFEDTNMLHLGGGK